MCFNGDASVGAFLSSLGLLPRDATLFPKGARTFNAFVMSKAAADKLKAYMASCDRASAWNNDCMAVCCGAACLLLFVCKQGRSRRLACGMACLSRLSWLHSLMLVRRPEGSHGVTCAPLLPHAAATELWPMGPA